ncbi:MAG: 50S ribosomal protein L7/L12 [Patescibacteria group bacterium]|nr:50S ribosomal protein L7/L12 [Patescibacteria group bacterium]
MADETTQAAAPAEAEVKEAPEAAEVPVEVPEKFKKLVEEIEKMTVLELSELVKVFEKKFGVSAAAVAVAGPAAAGPAEEAKSTMDVELTDAGGNKIAVIKAVKEALTLGLKEAKDLVDGVPSMLKQGMKKEEAEELAKKLTDAGAKVTLK